MLNSIHQFQLKLVPARKCVCVGEKEQEQEIEWDNNKSLGVFWKNLNWIVYIGGSVTAAVVVAAAVSYVGNTKREKTLKQLNNITFRAIKICGKSKSICIYCSVWMIQIIACLPRIKCIIGSDQNRQQQNSSHRTLCSVSNFSQLVLILL